MFCIGKRALIAQALFISAALLGCGGGGGGTGDASKDPNTVINGFVIDGPLVGAKVCLDTNRNWACDTGEPTAVSTQKGAFSLNISPNKYQDLSAYQVIAEVGPQVFDEATGKTLKESGQEGYVLAADVAQSPVLSPITTMLIMGQRAMGNVSPAEIATLLDRLKRAGFSTSPANYYDNASGLSEEERLKAQFTGRVVAALLSEAHSKLKNSDVGANIGQWGPRAMELLIQALSRTNFSVQGLTEAQVIDALKTALQSIILDPAAETLFSRTPVMLKPEDALAVMTEGVFDVNALGSAPRVVDRLSTTTAGDALQVQRYRYTSGQWTPDSAYTGQGADGVHVLYRVGLGTTDPFNKISTSAPSLVNQAAQLKEVFTEGGNVFGNDISLMSRDLGGLVFKALPELSLFSGQFSQGQRVHMVMRKALRDQYLFDSVAAFFGSLAQFKSSPRTCFAGICWSITQPATSGASAQEGVMRFETTSDSGAVVLGDGRFVEEVVAGVPVLRMVYVPIEVQTRSEMWEAWDGRHLVFADINGKLWMGRYIPAGTVWYSANFLSASGMNEVLSSAQIAPFAQ